MADIALGLDNVVKRYGPVTALNGLSFDVRQGEMFGLIGPDGAGKTTTIRLLCGLLHATRKPFGKTIAERQELRELEQTAPALLVAPEAVNLGEERDVLVDAQVAVETEPLREISNRPGDLGVIGDRILAEHAYRSAVGVEEPAQQPYRRGLASTIRADDAEHLALAHVERQAVERSHRSVAFDDVVETERDVCHHRLPRALLQLNLGFDRHSRLEHAVGVVHADLHAIDEA